MLLPGISCHERAVGAMASILPRWGAGLARQDRPYNRALARKVR